MSENMVLLPAYPRSFIDSYRKGDRDNLLNMLSGKSNAFASEAERYIKTPG